MSKALGLISEMRFELAATLKGFIVSSPPADNAPYDFILDNGRDLYRIQVKSTRDKDPLNRYHFNLKTGNQDLAYNEDQVHFFALYIVSTDTFYIIPRSLLNGHKTVKIFDNGKFEDYKEDWTFKVREIGNERD